MRDATHTAPIAPGTIPLPGLLEIAGEAMLAEFRDELVKHGYEDNPLLYAKSSYHYMPEEI